MCVRSVNVNRVESRGWGCVIYEVKHGLKIVNKVLKREALKNIHCLNRNK